MSVVSNAVFLERQNAHLIQKNIVITSSLKLQPRPWGPTARSLMMAQGPMAAARAVRTLNGPVLLPRAR